MPVADARVVSQNLSTGQVVQDQQKYTNNAMEAYLADLAQRRQQEALDKQGVQGDGFFSKVQNAIAGSPQMQTGLMAAGLSLVMGGNVADALTAGVGAVDQWNQLDQKQSEQKKAEALGSIKQQSQVENSQSEVDYRSRLPDTNSVQAARINAGASERMSSVQWAQLISNRASQLAADDVAAGRPPKSHSQYWVLAQQDFAKYAGSQGAVVPGVARPDAAPGGTNMRIPPKALGSIQGLLDKWRASNDPDKDAALLYAVSQYPGLELNFTSVGDIIAKTGWKPQGASPAPAPKPAAKPAGKGSQKPAPAPAKAPPQLPADVNDAFMRFMQGDMNAAGRTAPPPANFPYK